MSEAKIPLNEKYTLSIHEASVLFGIGEKRLRQIVAMHQGSGFILEVGTHVRIKRKQFAEFLDAATVL